MDFYNQVTKGPEALRSQLSEVAQEVPIGKSNDHSNIDSTEPSNFHSTVISNDNSNENTNIDPNVDSKENTTGDLGEKSSGDNLNDTQTTSSIHSEKQPLPDPEKAIDSSEGQPTTENKEAPPKPPMNPMMDPASFPDGGWEAWSVVIGAACCLFVSFGWINCIGVFQEYYQTHQLSNYSPGTVAWIPSLEACLMFLGGSWVGRLYDNYGPRWIILIGSFLHVFGLMMASLSTEYYQFLLSQGICSAIGASMIFYPAFSCIITWFFRRRAVAVGIAAAGSSLGGVIFPIMVTRLVAEVGFPWAMRICAFLILALLIVANILVKSRFPPFPKPVQMMDFVTPLTEVPFSLTTAAMFLYFFGLFIPFTFIVVEAIEKGMSTSLAGYLVSILNATSVFGRTLPAAVADKYGRFNMMVLMSFVTAVLVLALWIPASSNAAIIVFAALFGFTSGSIVSLAPAMVAQISDVRQIGVRTGTVFTFVAIAVLVGNPIGGALVTEDKGRFVKLQIFAGIMMIAGSCFFLAARVSLVGFALLKKV